jgi:hypothetical protein
VIWYTLAQGIKLLNYGKLILDIARGHIQGMKLGLGNSQFLKMEKFL